MVLVLAGTMEACLGGETGRLSTGQAVLIPALVPHGFRNIGNETAQLAVSFPTLTVEATFDQPMMPVGQRVARTPTVDSAL